MERLRTSGTPHNGHRRGAHPLNHGSGCMICHRHVCPTALRSATTRGKPARILIGAVILSLCAAAASRGVAQTPGQPNGGAPPLPNYQPLESLQLSLPLDTNGPGPTEGQVAAPSPNMALTTSIDPELEQMLQSRGDLTLRNSTLSEALFTVCESWDVSIVFGKDLDGSVNGVFRNATLAEVLDSLLLANGYGYRLRGKNLVVMPLSELGDANGMLRSKSFPTAGGGARLIESVRLLLSPQGKAQPVPEAHLLMVRDFPENLRRVEGFLTQVSRGATLRTIPSPRDQAQQGPSQVPASPMAHSPTAQVQAALAPPQVAHFAPQYVQVAAVESAMETVLTGAKIASVPEENRLIVVADAATLKIAHDVFQRIDVARAQVRITAMIYDVSLEDLERLGVNWTHGLKSSSSANGLPRHSAGSHFGGAPIAGSSFDILQSAATTATSTASPFMGATRFLTFNKYFDLQAIINALDESKGAKLLADPTVTVLDREDANIKIVTEIPIQAVDPDGPGRSDWHDDISRGWRHFDGDSANRPGPDDSDEGDAEFQRADRVQ